MRIISSGLLAAQKSDSAVPYLRVTVSDRIGGVHRLSWTRLYSGAEPDGYHAACVPGDGSLVRARVSGGHVYYQRVASPGPGSDFSTWTDLGAAANAGVALCANGSLVLLFYVDSGGLLARVRESTDNGATLGAAVTAATAPGAVVWLAADVKPSGDTLVAYSVGATVFAARRLSGTWGAPSAWPNSVASISGMGCAYNADWNLAVAGTDAAGQSFVWTTLVGDGFTKPAGVWSNALSELMRASAGSSVAYRAPFLDRVDTYRLTFVEKYTGTTAYARPYHSYSPAAADFAFNAWREPVPFDLASDYGQAIAASSQAVWLSTPSGVWSAPLAVNTLDVTADVRECSSRDAPFEGRVQLLLRNDDGRYSGLPAPLAIGAELRVGPGYRTSAGAEAADGPSYWIERIERRTGGGEGSVLITAGNGWSLLEAWRARRSFAWAAGSATAFVILQTLFARAGLEFGGVSPSSDVTGLTPAFTVQPGESALTAVRRLLATVPDVIVMWRESATLTEPLASQAASFAYGTDYRILGGRYADAAPAANRAQAFGQGVFAESFDWPSIGLAFDRLEKDADRNLTTLTQVQDRADATLRRALRGAQSGEITVPVNCALELWDVIEVTDPLAGLSAAKRRVAGIEMRYSTGARPRYDQTLTLAAP
ncbi:MAG TPA: hypothetical protein VMT90_10005 [Dehalococcoidia bacterium]|nr:hypothetical protein [Dehalococcoidia bacterium]